MSANTISALQSTIHSWAVGKGWWDKPITEELIAAKLALIHSEVSEALEELRSSRSYDFKTVIDGKPEGFSIELADTMIRILDLAGALGLDLENALNEKMEYNHTRPHKHGGKAL